MVAMPKLEDAFYNLFAQINRVQPYAKFSIYDMVSKKENLFASRPFVLFFDKLLRARVGRAIQSTHL